MATREYSWDVRRIIAVDGEGMDINGRHAYTLLAASDDRGYQRHVSYDMACCSREGAQGEAQATGVAASVLAPGLSYGITAWHGKGKAREGTGREPYGLDDIAPNYGLTTIQCFEFLLALPRYRSDIIVAFSFTYDTTMILQDLPLRALREIAETSETVWRGYRIKYVPRKTLTIETFYGKVTVNDVFSFWQMSFVRALESCVKKDRTSEIFTPEQIETIEYIAYMKAHRDDFEHMPSPEILRYCLLECEYLSIMMRDFLHQVEIMGLPITQRSITGPGGIADSYFSLHKLAEYMPTVSEWSAAPGLPRGVPMAAYYGGRFEIRMLGNVGDTHEYDIQSAYPSWAVRLPCLAHGHFEKVAHYVPGKLGFYEVGSKTEGPWAPFPFRVHHDRTNDWARAHGVRTAPKWFADASNGAIAFAHGGRRWVTSMEVETARRHFGDDAIPVYRGYIFHVGCTHRPFKHIEEMYLRRKVGDPTCADCMASANRQCERHKVSDGLSKIIKLIINSIYGKLAQTIGKGTYRNHIWAAWITGGTRAQILDAIMRDPDNVLSVATDGILTRREIPTDDTFRVTEYELGTWEHTPKRDTWLGMPGIYGHGRDDAQAKLFKRRGLEQRYFPLSYLRSQWDDGKWVIQPIEPIRAFMPLRLAVQRKNSLTVLGQWVTMPRRVDFATARRKRMIDDDSLLMPPFTHGERIPLIPITVPDDLISQPYEIIERDPEMYDSDMDIPTWEPSDFVDDNLDPSIYTER